MHMSYVFIHPMYLSQLHLVHKRSDFDSISDALSSGEPDALAVLGVFFKVIITQCH